VPEWPAGRPIPPVAAAQRRALGRPRHLQRRL